MGIVRSDGQSVGFDDRSGIASYNTSNSAVGITRLVAGQYVTVEVYQNSGGALAADSASFFDMTWLGP
jgi:hypothetical protein